MINFEYQKKALNELAQLQIRLNIKGGPQEDGGLFEQILQIEDDVLTSFGLPLSPMYQALILFNDLPLDFEINERINQLHSAATEYLSSGVKSELQILRDAYELKQDPFIVLSELKMCTHAYTIFVYKNILLNQKDSVENVLKELKFVNQPLFLDLLGRLSLNMIIEPVGLISILKDSGVRYIDSFIRVNAEMHKLEMD